MRPQTKYLSFLLIMVAILAVGCDVIFQTASSNTSTAAPGLVDTLVVQTISARETQTAAAQPTGTTTPTSTSIVLPTSVLLTATTFVVLPPSSGGVSKSTPAYACDPDIGKRPRDNQVFHPGDDFNIKWTILNTGTKTWVAGYDLTYLSGPQMTATTFVQLPEVKPGDTFSVTLSGAAPAQKGFQVMTWKLQGGFCFPYVAILVQ